VDITWTSGLSSIDGLGSARHSDGTHADQGGLVPVPARASDVPDEADVRQWLTCLRQPDRLAETSLVALLRDQGRLPETETGIEVGRAAAALLTESIERLRAADGASREEQLPYDVLQTSFLSGMKRVQAASRLGISPRQLTRYRSRAIHLLRVELATVAPAPTSVYRFPPVPAIIDFQARPAMSNRIVQALDAERFVHVHGHMGIGKTCLVADLAVRVASGRPVLWYRFRGGVNDSLASLLFELGEHLRGRGRPAPAEAFGSAGVVDLGLVSRMIVRDLDGLPLMLVLDDYHVVDGDSAVAGFLDDATARLTGLRVVTIGRHSDPPAGAGMAIEVQPMTRLETQNLLSQLSVRTSPEMGDAIQRWTAGLPQLIRLAGSWLRSASDEEVARGLTGFTDLEEVQSFLLGSIAELIDTADRTVLDAASVFRQPFNNEALAFVGNLSVGTVRDTSRRLVRAHVGARSRDGNVAFFHGSVREYFYSRLTPQRRAELHGRVAEWYDRTEQREEAAFHRAQAEQDPPAPRRTPRRKLPT
jgi:hypothetical protein